MYHISLRHCSRCQGLLRLRVSASGWPWPLDYPSTSKLVCQLSAVLTNINLKCHSLESSSQQEALLLLGHGASGASGTAESDLDGACQQTVTC